MVTEGVVTAVKKIVDVYLADDGVKYFRINWNDTWEPESHLLSCEELLVKFWKDKADPVQIECNEENKHTSVEQQDISETTTSVSCNCGKPTNTNIEKRTFHVKSTQHSDSGKKSELGIQVNTYLRENRNVSVQVGPGTIKTSELGIQVNTCLRENKNVSVQVSPGTVETSELGIQVNKRTTKIRNVKVQCKPKTVERGIQNVATYKNQFSQFENTLFTVECGIQNVATYENQFSQFENTLFKKEVSTQLTPEAEDCAIQNVVISQDQYSQYETSFSDCGEGVIFQKEVSIQFSPETIDCGIQYGVYVKDQFTQCDENKFQKEVACQYIPTTASCGIQKDVQNLDKCCQYETDFVSSLETSSNIDTQLCADTTSPNETSVIGTQLYSHISCDVLTQDDTQPYAEDIDDNASQHCTQLYAEGIDDDVSQRCTQLYLDNNNEKSSQLASELHNENIHCNIASQPCTQPYDNNTAMGQAFQDVTHKYTELIEDQALDFNTTVDINRETAEDNSGGKMKEMIFVADIPFDIQQSDVSHESHSNKNIDSASTSVIPDESTAQNPPICIILSSGEEAILDSQKTSDAALSQDLLFQPSHGCISDEIILNSQTPANISLPKNVMFQPNNTCLEDQTILDSGKPNASLPQHFIFQSQNECSSGQATILNTQQLVTSTLPKELILKLTNNSSPTLTMQLLNESIASLEEELTCLNQPDSDVQSTTPVTSKKRQKSQSPSIIDKRLEVSDPTQIMCHNLKPPDISKKGISNKGKLKRKRSSDKNRSINSTDGKPQARTKKKKNVIFDEQSNSDITSVISKQTLNEICCLPVYDIIPCTNPAKDERINVRTSLVNCDVIEGVNTVNCDANKEISKFGNTSLSETPKTLPSNGNNINDDFISKYWK